MTRVGGKQPLHPACNITIGRRLNDQMHVIGHEAYRKQWQLNMFLRFCHELNERGVVGGFMKDLGFSIRPIEHVVVVTGEYLARRAGHALKVSARGEIRAA
jgi:hypothetical protein